MRVPPFLIVSAITVLVTTWVAGSVLSPDSAPHLTSAIVPCIAVFLALLKQDRDQHEVVQRFEQNDRKTADVKTAVEEKTQEVKETVLKKGTEVRQALVIAEQEKNQKLDSIAQDVKTVVEQTNGTLTKRLEEIKEAVAKPATSNP